MASNPTVLALVITTTCRIVEPRRNTARIGEPLLKRAAPESGGGEDVAGLRENRLLVVLRRSWLALPG